MDHRDTLLTLAEIAVALAGFTGLVSVIGHRHDDASRRVDWFRLRMMLEVSLRNAAFALLPLPLLDVVSSESTIWRLASGIYLVTVPAHVLFRRRQEGADTVVRTLTGSSLGLLPVSLLACLANVFGLGGAHAFSLYFLSLLLGLVAAGLLFLSAATSLLGNEQK